MNYYDEVTNDVYRARNIQIELQDGISLATDVYLPAVAVEQGEPVPVVLEYTPYRKDDVDPGSGDNRFLVELPRRGFAVVKADVRGTGGSAGGVTDEYSWREQLDGAEAVEWLSQQSWCDGHVNMIGMSYGGFTALQVASLRPRGLTSIVPMFFTDDRYSNDCHYDGGLLRGYYDTSHYGTFMAAWNALPPNSDWAADWADVWKEHLERNEPYLLEWLRHQVDSDYWHNGSVGQDPASIQCPVFLVGGWMDGYATPAVRLFEQLEVPKRLLVGPWGHAMPDIAIPGPRIDIWQEVAAWFGRWCTPENTPGPLRGDEPPVLVYMQTAPSPDPNRLDTPGVWRAETTWPPPGVTERKLYLRGFGILDEESSRVVESDEIHYDPTVGITHGLWSAGVPFGLPVEQSTDEVRSLTYTSPPLESPLDVLGVPRARLYVSSSASVIGFSVVLSDVAPDGTSMLVCKGMKNVTRRESLTGPSPLPPGTVVPLEVDLSATGWTFRKGHRLRVSVANADWPNVWPTPETARSQVFRGPTSESMVLLPIVPAEGSSQTAHPSPSPVRIERHDEKVDPPVWRFEHDILTDRSTVVLEFESGHRVDRQTVVQRKSAGRMSVCRSAPWMASAVGEHETRIRHMNTETLGISHVTVRASRSHFHLTVGIEVRIDEMPVVSRNWCISVPRALL